MTNLRDLLKGVALRDTAELVKRYVNEFKEVLAALVVKWRLTKYD